MKKLYRVILITGLIIALMGGSIPVLAVTPVLPPLELAPAAPSNLSLTKFSTLVMLTWKVNSTNETGFKIEHKIDNGEFILLGTTEAGINTYDKNYMILSGTDYTYRVCAYNAWGNSAYSNEVYFSTAKPPLPPGSLTASPGTTSIQLNWLDNSKNEKGFIVQSYTAGGYAAITPLLPPNTTSYTISGLESGKTYKYRVVAKNDYGESVSSNEVTVTTIREVELQLPGPINILPPVPGDLAARPDSQTIVSLSWTDTSNLESGFRLERKQEGGSYAAIAEIGANTTSYIDGGLLPGTVYMYRIKAYNGFGESGYSAEAAVITPAAVIEPVTPVTPGGEIPVGDPGKTILRFYLDRVESYVKPMGQSSSQLQSMDTAPISREGRTLLPIKYVAQPLGASVSWDALEQKVTVAQGAKHIELWINRNKARVDGLEKDIDPANPAIAPVIVPPGRTMLPLRFITENLGCSVDWEPVSREVKVTYPGN